MSSRVSLSGVAEELETLTDEERAALRASRFHAAPPAPHLDRRCRLAHPGGALATNKAAALAKFLKRKLKEDGAASLDQALVQRAVENAKATARSGPSKALANVRHVDSFSDPDEDQDKDFKSKKVKRIGGTDHACKTKKKNKTKKLHKLVNVEHVKSLKVKGKKTKKNKKPQ